MYPVMTRNPVVNGLTASAYIFVLVLFLDYGMKVGNRPETFIVPVIMISIFTLSAAVMGFLFGYQPFQLWFDGKKGEAVKLFLQTTLVFGIVTAMVALLYFNGILP